MLSTGPGLPPAGGGEEQSPRGAQHRPWHCTLLSPAGTIVQEPCEGWFGLGSRTQLRKSSRTRGWRALTSLRWGELGPRTVQTQ